MLCHVIYVQDCILFAVRASRVTKPIVAFSIANKASTSLLLRRKQRAWQPEVGHASRNHANIAGVKTPRAQQCATLQRPPGATQGGHPQSVSL